MHKSPSLSSISRASCATKSTANLDDITPISRDFRPWDRRPPRYKGKLKAYAALTRTCQPINHEASTMFETQYLPNMTSHFDDVLAFFGLCGPDARNSLTTSSATFVLKTPIARMHAENNFPGILTMSLMTSRHFNDVLLPRRTKRPFYSRAPNASRSTTADGESSLAVYHLSGGREYRVLKYPRVPSKGPLLRAYGRVCFVRPEGTGQVVQTIEGRCGNLSWRGVDRLAVDEVVDDFVRGWADKEGKGHRQVWKALNRR